LRGCRRVQWRFRRPERGQFGLQAPVFTLELAECIGLALDRPPAGRQLSHERSNDRRQRGLDHGGDRVACRL
jgi:hypothetical protein